jgi:hypothetical protein
MSVISDTSLGFGWRRSGLTAPAERQAERVAEDTAGAPTPSGVIYTGNEPPPVAELLVRYEDIIAMLDRPLPAFRTDVVVRSMDVAHSMVVAHPNLTLTADTTARAQPMRLSWATEVVSFAAITGAISAVGWFLLMSSVISGHLRANPYIALSLALGGLALTATVAVAAKSPPSG